VPHAPEDHCAQPPVANRQRFDPVLGRLAIPEAGRRMARRFEHANHRVDDAAYTIGAARIPIGFSKYS
jgi:hypothetical protein